MQVKQEWIKSLEPSLYDMSFAMQSDDLGNVYVAGASPLSPILTGSKAIDSWLVKYSYTGEQMWRHRLQYDSTDFPVAFAIDKTGSVYLAGYTRIENQPTTNWLAKFSPFGVEQWQYNFQEYSLDSCSLALDETGNVYFAGHLLTETREMCLMKLSSGREQIWVNRLGYKSDIPAQIAIIDDKAYVAGALADKTWLVALNVSTSAKVFEKQLFNESSASISGIAADNANNIHIATVITKHESPTESEIRLSTLHPKGTIENNSVLKGEDIKSALVSPPVFDENKNILHIAVSSKNGTRILRFAPENVKNPQTIMLSKDPHEQIGSTRETPMPMVFDKRRQLYFAISSPEKQTRKMKVQVVKCYHVPDTFPDINELEHCYYSYLLDLTGKQSAPADIELDVGKAPHNAGEFNERSRERLLTVQKSVGNNPAEIALGTKKVKASYISAPTDKYDVTKAVDGDSTTYWKSASPKQWIEIDLGATMKISAINLHVFQETAGQTNHVLYVSPMGSNHMKLYQLNLVTKDHDMLTIYFPRTVIARLLKIETDTSPSIVGWRQIRVFGHDDFVLNFKY